MGQKRRLKLSEYQRELVPGSDSPDTRRPEAGSWGPWHIPGVSRCSHVAHW